MRRAIGTALGGFAGLAFTTFGLVDTSHGLHIGGGNEATPTVIAIGVVVGALAGAAILWHWPTAILGATVGLAGGIWLRDNLAFGGVQPPWVFLLLFGLPAAGAAGGYLLHRSRR